MPKFSYALGNSKISVVCEKGPKTKVAQPNEVYAYWQEHVYPAMHNENKEHLWVFATNNQNRIIAWELNSLGGINSTVADIRTIFQFLLVSGAASFFIIHNHPSGELTPSIEDLRITREIVSASKLLNLRFIDHLVVTPTQFYSMRQTGVVNFD